MMKTVAVSSFRNGLWLFLLLAATLRVSAQDASIIQRAEAGRMGDSVSVVVSLSPLLSEVGANEVVTIVPHLQAAADTVVLPAIHLLGKMPYYRYIRHDDMSLLMPHDRVLRAHPHQPPFVYREAVSWQQWMQQAELCLVVRRSRLCCDLPADSITAQRPQMRLQQAPPIIVETSTDSVKGTVRVLFPVNRTEIHPEYMGNSRELSRLEQSIRAVSDDPQTDLQGIIIRGTASPEGPYAKNDSLARYRTNSLADYVAQQSSIDRSKVHTSHVAENWDGLVRHLRQATLRQLPHRDELLAIATDDTLMPDEKEQQMRQRYAAEYRWLLANVMPLLRQTDYRIDYQRRTVNERSGGMDTLWQMPAAADEPQQYTPLRPYKALFALKTNVLFDLALAFNGEIEVPLGRNNRWSVMGEFWKPWFVWHHNSRAYQLQVLGGEVRYWFGRCRERKPALTGFFVGPYIAWGKYDFEWNSSGDQGEFYSIGITAGYVWPIHRRWNLELSASIGTLGGGWLGGERRHYNGRFDDSHLIWEYTTTSAYTGPTKLKVTLAWIIGKKRKEVRP